MYKGDNMEGGTVKQFLDALEEMRALYPFKDEETILCTRDFHRLTHNSLSIRTKDEKTGIYVEMTKEIPDMR